MKNNRSIIFGITGFILGALILSIWKTYNYVSIPKENTRRSISSQSTGQQLVIDQLTDRILSIKTKADIDKTAQEIVSTAEKYPTFVGVQMFGEFARVVPVLKGLLWRLRGVVEETDILHTFILSNMRFIYFSRYMYGPHLKAVFHYLADPPSDMLQFESISEFQDTVISKIRPILTRSIEKSIASLTLPAENHHFTLDRRIFTGHEESKRYFDPVEIPREFIKPYMSYIISGLARAVGTIDYIGAYNLDDLTTVMKDNLTKTAFNKIQGRLRVPYIRKDAKENIKSLPQVLSRKEVFDIIRTKSRFLTARLDDRMMTQNLSSAYKMFQLASEHDLKGYVCTITYASMMMKREGIEQNYNCDWDFMENESFMEEEYFVVGGKNFLIDPNQLLINHRQKFHELRDRYRIYHPEDKNGLVSITSDVTGETIRINVKEFFIYKNSLKDLKKYLPTSYSNSLNFEDINISTGVGAINNRGQWVWNYDYGRPLQWENGYTTFGGLFPDANNENMYDIMYTVRLTQSLRPFSNMFTTAP